MEGNNNFYQNPPNNSNLFPKYQPRNTGFNSNSQFYSFTPTASSRPEINYDFKQRNKGMFQSTMNLNTQTQSNLSLNSFARRVQEVPLNQESIGGSKFLDTKYQANTNQFSYGHSKDPKMASSAIFPLNNNTEDQFDRFPSFNLKANPTFQLAKQKKDNSNVFPPKQAANENIKQKRQRQIAAIKKQVEELNKKMLNKPIPNISTTLQDMKSPKHLNTASTTAANQSSTIPNIIGQPDKYRVTDSRPQQNYTKFDLPNFNENGNKFQSSFNQQNKVYENEPTSKFVPNKYNQSLGINNEPSILSKYKNNPYSNSSSLSSVKSSQNFSTTNYINTAPRDAKVDLTPKQNNHENKFQQSLKISDTKSPSGLSKFSEANPEQTGFKKKKFYEDTEVKGQEKKFNFPLPANEQVKNLQTPVYPEKSMMTQEKKFKLKKIQSINYIDESISLPEVRTFKLADFQIGKKMGKGQFGEVLFVRHKLTGWICGLKVMDKKDIRDQDYVAQIARQLSIQFYLEHRNITQLYGYFEEGDKFYLLIEYCQGGQLLQKIRSQKRMKEKDVSKIIRQVCEGVDYIHKQQIIHRDLKPENILFNFDTVKICDFGWAVYRGFGMRKTASGSPLYYPPQIVKGEQYDDKIDVWNIGMMTYQCLEGKIPFKVYSELDLVRIVSDQITFPQYVDISENAKDFILKTMKKKGQQRIQIRQMLRHPLLSNSNELQISQSILIQFKRVLEG